MLQSSLKDLGFGAPVYHCWSLERSKASALFGKLWKNMGTCGEILGKPWFIGLVKGTILSGNPYI